MLRFGVLLCLVSAVGCASVAGPTQKTLAFASMQMLNEGVDGEWILAEYPHATEVERRPDGSLQKLGYWVTDPQGTPRPLVMRFDGGGTLTEKQYGGPVVRPPEENLDFGFGS